MANANLTIPVQVCCAVEAEAAMRKGMKANDPRAEGFIRGLCVGLMIGLGAAIAGAVIEAVTR